MVDSANFTNIRALLGALAEAMNLINADVEHHHEQTAYLAYLIAREMGLPEDMAYLCVYAALLHDVGSILVDEPQSVEEIEREERHIAQVGAAMLRDLPEFSRVADVIENCQCPWQVAHACAGSMTAAQRELLRCSGVIYLADQVSIRLDPRLPVLTQAQELRKRMEAGRGARFCPDASDAFLRISRMEFIWLDVAYNLKFLMFFTGDIQPVSLERTVVLTQLMSRLIDFRSPFTAMHSAGVAASARALAGFAGMSREECMMMEIAGNLHDIGKLKVQRSILEKPAHLDVEEYDVIREHPYYTRLILMNVDGFEDIANWAGYHHEKLNGSGYPFHFAADALDTGARILAIADIFSAITEDRPYRDGMKREAAMAVLRKQVDTGGLDDGLVELLADHYEEIDHARDEASHTVGKRYFASRGLTENVNR